MTASLALTATSSASRRPATLQHPTVVSVQLRGAPAEALLGDLLILAGASFGARIGALAAYALNTAADHGAQVARVVTDNVLLAAGLTTIGFIVVDTIRYYRPGREGSEGADA